MLLHKSIVEQNIGDSIRHRMTQTLTQLERLAKIASASAQARTVGRFVASTPGYLYCFSDDPEPYYANQVIPISDEAVGSVPEMIAFCEAHDRRVWIEFFEELFPDLLAALLAEGLCQWQTMPIMLNPGEISSVRPAIQARPAERADLEAVVGLCAVCFGFAGEKEDKEVSNLIAGIASGAKLVSVLEFEGRVVASGQTVTGSQVSELVGICTHPDFRRRGFARAVVQDLTRRAFASGNKVTWLTPGTVSAFHLYESEGYVVSGTQIAVGDADLREAELKLD